jgi:tripartite-type tricarboxylate transporter receptor subunit TctC
LLRYADIMSVTGIDATYSVAGSGGSVPQEEPASAHVASRRISLHCGRVGGLRPRRFCSRFFRLAEEKMARTLLVLLTVAFGAFAASPLSAQTFPGRLIRIVVPFPAGGPTDLLARHVSQRLSAILGQSVIVENEAGAGGRTGTQAVARANPDGYTLLLGGTNSNAMAGALYKSLNYDPIKDFVAVASIATDSNALVVNPAVPARTIAELVSYAKANPGKLVSGAALGIFPHFALELLKVRTEIDMIFVPYKGAAPAITDLLGGQIQVGAAAKSVLLPHIQAGKIRPLAVTSMTRWPELPEVPTMREGGFAGYPSEIWFGLLAPAATPPAIVAKLNAAINQSLQSSELRESFARLGLEVKIGTPGDFAAAIADDAREWQAIAKETGIKLE